MNTLMLQQQSLLDALFARPGSPQATSALHQLNTWIEPRASRGLMAYQANGHALAERCLPAAYPVVAQLIGQDSVHALARDLWHRHPPVGGDLAQWGDALPAFLSDNEQLADVPYLADVARVEWALHRAASAPDADPDLPSFGRLSTEDPESLTLRLAPGTEASSPATGRWSAWSPRTPPANPPWPRLVSACATAWVKPPWSGDRAGGRVWRRAPPTRSACCGRCSAARP